MITPLDGNVLAGPLGELFAVDITSAMGMCASCGTQNPIAMARVYMDAPGMVARCRNCDAVILRVVRSANQAWLDMRGISSLQLGMPSQ